MWNVFGIPMVAFCSVLSKMAAILSKNFGYPKKIDVFLFKFPIVKLSNGWDQSYFCYGRTFQNQTIGNLNVFSMQALTVYSNH